MRSINQPQPFSLFSRYPSGPLNHQAQGTEEYQQYSSLSYSLFSSHLPWTLAMPFSDQMVHIVDPDLEKIDLILDQIEERLTSFNESISSCYQISEKDVKIILNALFKAVDLSNQNSIFFDKNLIKTKNSAVYFIDPENRPCLFIKPSIKNTSFEESACFSDSAFSYGSEKMIKKIGFLIVFSDDLRTAINSYRCASFSKSFSQGKNQALKNAWEVNCQRNGFFPISFQDGKETHRYMFLIPYLGETIDKLWDYLSLEGKLYCVENIIRSAEQQSVNDIKIPNTLMLFIKKHVPPKISLIDGNDEQIIFTYTPYSEDRKNRKGRLSGMKTEEDVQSNQYRKELISDLKNLLEYISIIQSRANQNSVAIHEVKSACKKFILNLKYSKFIMEFFLKSNFQKIQDQILTLISEYESDIYLATRASEQEITEARVFSLAIMFWQLLNKKTALNLHSINTIFAFNSYKIPPELCRQRREDWCLHRNRRDETALTEIVLKGYEKKLSYTELLEAVCEEIRKMH